MDETAKEPLRPLTGGQRLAARVKRAVVPPSKDQLVARNSYFLVREMLWTGLLTSATSFGSNFAVRLGASNQLVGVLTAGQSAIMVLLMLPAAQLIERVSNRIGWMVWGRAIQRLMFLLVALMPFVVPAPYQAPVFVALMLLRILALAPHQAGWSTLLADLAPPKQLTSLMARRRMLMSSVTIVATPLLGALLDRIVFPYGYQVAFAFAFLMGVFGTRDLLQLREPQERRVAPTAKVSKPGFKLDLSLLGEMWTDYQPYARIVITTLLFTLGGWLASSLYIIHYLRNLGASDSWVGTLTSLGSLSAVIGAYFWQKVMPRWGDHRALCIVAPLMGTLPLVVGLTHQLWPIMVAVAVNNWMMVGLEFSRYNMLIKVTPPDRRPTFMSMHMTLLNLGAAFMPMIGVSWADRIGIPAVLVVAGVSRVLFGLMYALWPPKLEEAPPS